MTNTFHTPPFKKDLVYDEVINLLRSHKETKLAKKDWTNFEKNLEKLDVQQDLRFSIILWAQAHVKDYSDIKFFHRMLHDLEKDMISTEAYGCLVEAVYFGLMTWNDMDDILEEIVADMSLPITSTSIKSVLADRWFKEAKDTDIKIN